MGIHSGRLLKSHEPMGIRNGISYGGAITAARDGDPNGLHTSPIVVDAGAFYAHPKTIKGVSLWD